MYYEREVVFESMDIFQEQIVTGLKGKKMDAIFVSRYKKTRKCYMYIFKNNSLYSLKLYTNYKLLIW